jgi:hypothetical protein
MSTSALSTRCAALMLCAGLAAAGCAAERADDPSTPAEDTVTSPTDDPSDAPSPSGRTARQAIADLAERLGVPPEEIEVVRVEEVVWRDGSLGCPEPGMHYTQALVDGSRIVLSAGGRAYEYHAGGSQTPFLCERPTE